MPGTDYLEGIEERLWWIVEKLWLRVDSRLADVEMNAREEGVRLLGRVN